MLSADQLACLATNTTIVDELPRMSPWLLLLASAHALLGMEAVIANWTVFSFYTSKAKHLVPYMYLVMSGCDIVTGVTALLNATIFVSLVLMKEVPMDRLPSVIVILSAIHCCLIMMTARVSVAYNILLAVVRTRALAFPFSRQPMWLLVTLTLLVPVGLSPLIGLQVNYFLVNGQYSLLLFTPYLGAKWLGFIGLHLNILIPFVLPSIVALICLGVQSWTLVKSRRAVRAHGTDNQREITKTIVLLTLLFFICNTTFAVSFYVDTFTFFVTCLPPHLRLILGVFFTGTLSILNAAINPVILVVRGTKLREFAFGRGGGSGRGLHRLLTPTRSQSYTSC
eukprot:sb/3466478/